MELESIYGNKILNWFFFFFLNKHTSVVDLKVIQKLTRNLKLIWAKTNINACISMRFFFFCYWAISRVSTWMWNFVSRTMSQQLPIFIREKKKNIYEILVDDIKCKYVNTYAVGSAVLCTIFQWWFVRFRCIFGFVKVGE